MSWRSGVLGVAALIFVAGSVTPASAEGLFEAIGNALFGHGPARVQPSDGVEPLRMSVRPRQHRVHRESLRRGRHRIVAAVAKAPPVKIDPEANPTWYLGDTTLRRGDIVVTRTGAVVFDGAAGAQHGLDEFVALSGTRLVSPEKQREVAYAVAGWMPPAADVTSSRTDGRQRIRRSRRRAARR